MEHEQSYDDESLRSRPKLQRNRGSERMEHDTPNSARHNTTFLDLGNLNLNANTLNVMLPTVISKEDRDEKAHIKKL